MYLCKACHEYRQEKETDSKRPLAFAWTGEDPYRVQKGCDTCTTRKKGPRWEYKTATHLAMDLVKVREELEQSRERTLYPDFPISGFHSAADLLHHVQCHGEALLRDKETAYQILKFAAEVTSE